MIHLFLLTKWGYILVTAYNLYFICFIQPLLGLSLAQHVIMILVYPF